MTTLVGSHLTSTRPDPPQKSYMVCGRWFAALLALVLDLTALNGHRLVPSRFEPSNVRSNVPGALLVALFCSYLGLITPAQIELFR